MNLRPKLTAFAAAAAVAAIAIPTVAVGAADGATTVRGTPTAAVALAAEHVAEPAVAAGANAVTITSAAHPASSPAKTTPASRAKHHRQRWLRRHGFRLAGVLHAQWTTKAKDGKFVTHDAIHGSVTTLTTGAASITVTAADHTAETYATATSTKVWKVTTVDGKRRIEKSTLQAVTKNAEVIVEGTGAKGPFAATRILVLLPKK